MEEERFTYNGYGALGPDRFKGQSATVKVLFMDIDAVFPRLGSEPELNRVDYEIVKRSPGWEVGNDYQALSGWRKRIREACVGFHGAYVFAYENEPRTELLTTGMAACIHGARVDWWRLRHWGYGQESDYYVESFADCVNRLRQAGGFEPELTIYLNRDTHFVDAVRAGLAGRDTDLRFTINAVHPQLGLFARRLPLPREFTHLDEWLDSREPLPGEVKPWKG